MIEFIVNNLKIKVTPFNITIIDSYKIKDKKVMKKMIEEILYKAPIYKQTRSVKSLVREWRTHNIMYNKGWFVIHTKDCDLESYEALYRRIIYFIVGRF